jgi:hypothetical protein
MRGREGVYIILIMIVDIINFKLINDKHLLFIHLTNVTIFFSSSTLNRNNILHIFSIVELTVKTGAVVVVIV